MAAIDGLLSLVVSEGAEQLEVVEGEAPEITKAGERKRLSMPALHAALVQRFIGEVRAAGDGTAYVLDSKGQRSSFAVAIEAPRRIVFRLEGASDGERAAEPEAMAEAQPRTASGEAPPAPIGGTDEPASRARPSAAAMRLIEQAVAADATDLFLSTAADARMRVGMELHEIPASRLGEDDVLELTGLDGERRAQLDEHGSVDLALEVGATRIRANVFRHRGGLAVAVRPIRRIRTIAELGLPADLESLTRLPDGLVLFVGPTGSGKSSTLAALLDHLNHRASRHIVTIEDPVEFEYESDRCLIHQREVGRDVESFAAGLRAALRESPDVILVGEMRDRDTFAAALTAAETGHLVFSTLHSGSAPMAIDRILDSFPPHQQAQVRHQLAGALRAIVVQVLLPAVEPGGLVPATERMMVTHAIAHAIRDARGHQIADRIHTGRAEGMISLDSSLADLVRRGRITAATALSAARNPDIVRQLLAS